MARLFVALELPASVAARLGALRTNLPHAKWASTDRMHLTVRFLGDVSPTAVDGVGSALTALSSPAFDLAVAGVGVFPGGRKPPRVLWAGLTPAEPVSALRAQVDRALDPLLGPDPEAQSRRFTPHLTLARFKDRPGRAIDEFLAEHRALTTAPWRVREVVLFRSHLGANGARHEPLVRVALAP